MNKSIIDLQEALERVQDDKELLCELFDIFEEDFLLKRKGLAEAVLKKDILTFRNIAHALKGASGNISAKIIRESFAHLEKMGEEGNLGGVEAILNQIDQQFKDLQATTAHLREQLRK